ncbi:hypothetical protein [Luteimonas sp. 3794]|uniref:hypothetical protein n=1 Tax=Luteimonas sp. 3794 TaxID=2817730 RepID=UPI00286670DC|nr:hypothetical protein [Luteimonas sp. 3794]MDR6990646.1 hypothetical protein [Luteimonas sp. 3794]
MSHNFNELDNLTLEQKQQLLTLIAALVESAETKQSQAYDSGDKAQKLAVMQDALGLVKLRHEIKDMRDALQKSPSIRTTSLIDPVLRYIENAA